MLMGTLNGSICVGCNSTRKVDGSVVLSIGRGHVMRERGKKNDERKTVKRDFAQLVSAFIDEVGAFGYCNGFKKDPGSVTFYVRCGINVIEVDAAFGLSGILGYCCLLIL
jgi:hypothetical protein